MIEQEKRFEFWDYLTNEKTTRPKGVTVTRLEKIKTQIMEDDSFWEDVISRHGADFMSAIEFYAEGRRARSDHSRANFWSMVRERILKDKK